MDAYQLMFIDRLVAHEGGNRGKMQGIISISIEEERMLKALIAYLEQKQEEEKQKEDKKTTLLVLTPDSVGKWINMLNESDLSIGNFYDAKK